MNRKKALAMLGVAATFAYATPNVMALSQAHASGAPGGGWLFSLFGFGGEGGGFNEFAPKDAVTVQECSDCHQAYAPELMPQGAWQILMGDLSNHFGEDASLDEVTRAHIEQYLLSRSPRGTGPVRITQQRWFVSEHRGGGNTMFKCDACHG